MHIMLSISIKRDKIVPMIAFMKRTDIGKASLKGSSSTTIRGMTDKMDFFLCDKITKESFSSIGRAIIYHKNLIIASGENALDYFHDSSGLVIRADEEYDITFWHVE